MILAILLGANLLISALILLIPNMTRREILFGVVVPVDFRSSPEGRRAIRIFRSVVASRRSPASLPLHFGAHDSFPGSPHWCLPTAFAERCTFVCDESKDQTVRGPTADLFAILELSAEPERLPWFIWLGLVPLLLLVAAALYLHAHWDSIPPRYPVHWDLEWKSEPMGGPVLPRCLRSTAFRGRDGGLAFRIRAGDLVWIAPSRNRSGGRSMGFCGSGRMGLRIDDGRCRAGTC